MRKPLLTTMISTPLAVLMLSPASWAMSNEKGYSEVYYMHQTMEATGGADAKPGAVQIRIGTTFEKYFGLEGVFALGIIEDEFYPNVSGKLSTLFGANAVGIFNLENKADLFGRIGFAQMDVDIEGKSFDGTGIMYSFGFDIRTSRYGAVALEYQVLPDVKEGGDKLETTSINLGYRLRF